MWPVLSNGIPISLPPFLPPSMALFFTLIYLPLLLLAMLNSAAPDIVMKSTPRKNIYQTRDRYRFVLYLLIRSFYISVSVFIVGWFAAASVNTHYLDPNSWDHAMDTFMPIFTSSNNTTDYLPSFYLIQDIMSCQQLLCIYTFEAWSILSFSTYTFYAYMVLYSNLHMFNYSFSSPGSSTIHSSRKQYNYRLSRLRMASVDNYGLNKYCIYFRRIGMQCS